MMRIGIVGTGRRAASFAEELLKSKHFCHRAQLAALCDINPKRMAAFQSLYAPGVATHKDYDAFLEKGKLDGVIGDVVMVSVVETLEGSNHFNRWHRHKAISGGIMLQKGTHTLDLIIGAPSRASPPNNPWRSGAS